MISIVLIFYFRISKLCKNYIISSPNFKGTTTVRTEINDAQNPIPVSPTAIISIARFCLVVVAYFVRDANALSLEKPDKLHNFYIREHSSIILDLVLRR